MITLPDPTDAFQHEQDFLLTCSPSRIGKILALHHLYQQILTIPGAIVECGVFRGGSFTTWAILRNLLESEHVRPLIGFDTFDGIPAATTAADGKLLDHYGDLAGTNCIGADQLHQTLADRGRGLETNTTLVPGDICATVPKYVHEHSELAIALLLIDTNQYEPGTTCFEHLVPLVSPGGIVIVDNFGTFPGETRAVREYLAEHPDVVLERAPHTGHFTYFRPGPARS
ncbi:TylF/MycF/NovP-related O-methyltransferase [Myceligenerans crystallogenes]|uniref:Macrocin-O-methyltransferase (TylF) n=1 Tax=Myceligenerans crystallogenes TaxID=316335 RepID=A0ABN2ND81_9MICO